LLAEDEPALLELYCEFLTSLGYTCIAAQDGNEALKFIRSEPPDLVLTDFMLPGKTGADILREIKTEPSLSHIPSILISAGSPPERDQESASMFLRKPVPLDRLEQAVRQTLAPPVVEEAEAHAPATVSPMSLAREEMLSWVAHEVKTPLSAALTASDLAMRKLPTDEPSEAVRKLLRVISRQLHRMDELINSILDAAQLEHGNLPLELQRTDIGEFVERIVAYWAELHPDIEFELKNGGLAEVDADPERLRQVLDNLISNAIKYGRSGKCVLLEIREASDSVRISVTDYGPGIPQHELASIFNRYRRIPGQGGRGHGLGLYVAGALARHHGGNLSVRSEVGKGSTFTLSLPRRR
jgi:signal transduction histidine kinase